ncbi:HesA/MoeB/ThiF family protein [Vibrio cholerae]|uniref:HesA/MoeB/ThiF family protein n=1 Tax=Vibrio cholerae TaxID=666 RepID=UPI00115C0956|nr:ThiF family adenylyltransferase [Vibrio cholerae]TQQ47056.1 ThiF family adenylyltransferase [Vibrio cholerae]
MILKLANYVQVAPCSIGGYFGAGGNQHRIDSHAEWRALMIVSSTWKKPLDEQSLRALCMKELNESELDYAVNFLKNTQSLIEDGEFNNEDRYSRNKLYYNLLGGKPSEVQAKIEASHVTIIGCGGIGNYISYKLATSGIKKITIVDGDYIEASNLTRQVLFGEDDCGRDKIDVLERELCRRNSTVEIEKLKLHISCLSDISKIPPSDLFVVSADHPANLIFLINEYCVSNKQPYINVGYINDIAVVGPFYIPGQTSCIQCDDIVSDFSMSGALADKIKIINSDFKASTFSSTNGISASYAFNDIMKFLGGYGEILSVNKRIGIHTQRVEIETQIINKNEACKKCSIVE